MASVEKTSADSGIESKAKGRKKLEKRIHALTARVAYMESTLAERGRESDRLASELSDLAAKGEILGTLETDLTAKGQQLAALEHDLADKGEKLGALENDLSAKDEKLDAMETDLAAKVQHLGILEHDLADKGEKLGALENDLSAKDEKLGALENNLSSKDEKLNTLETDLAAKGEKLSTLEADLSAVRSELGGMAQQLREMENAEDEQALLEGVKQEVSALGEEQRVRAEQVARLVTSVDRLRESDRHREQEGRENSGWMERAGEREDRMEQALELTGERLDRLEQTLDSAGVSLGSMEEEVRVRSEQVARLVTAVDRLREADRQREKELQETAGWKERVDEQEQRLQGLQASLESTGSNLGSMEEENRIRVEQLTGLVSAVNLLKESDRERQQEVQDSTFWIERASEREEQLENALKAAEERLQMLEAAGEQTGSSLDSLEEEKRSLETRISGLVSAVDLLQESDRQRQQDLVDSSGRIDRADQREEQLENALKAAEERLQQLETTGDETGASLGSIQEEKRALEEQVGGLESTIQLLRSSDEERLQQLREAAERIGQAEEREGRLDQALGKQQSSLRSMLEENGERDQKIDGTHSHLQTLTWSGAAALVALTAGGLLYINKQQNAQELMEHKLEQMARQVSGAGGGETAGGFGQLQELSEELGDLNSSLTDLSSQIGESQMAESQALNGRMDVLEREQAGMVENLDDLGGRLAQLEGQSSGAEQSTSAKPESEPLIPQAAAPVSSTLSPVQVWKQAQKQKKFTLQLVAVRKLSSLLAYARKHQLSDAAILEAVGGDGTWHVLLYGIYKSRAEAKEAFDQLAPKLPSGTEPWIRQIPKRGSIEPVG